MPICNTQINITPLLWDWWPICDKIQPYNPTYIFCASQTQFKMGICHGDFGGPLIDLKPGIYILQKIRNYANLKIQNGKTLPKLNIGIYSKFGQYYRYDITMYDFIHIIQFLIPIWSWISKMMLENVTFFTFLLECG